ncbi:MAG: hypothetical protein E5X80_14755 [Mesorhizobium sp.]|nr:MAG: hypothetical protein EOR13_26120 [Mesorhizobium sp.]TIO54319.1 MAG: hypothetical protein E5X78_03695 [Mesorhizobium sp.]TIO59463.1 MAG: hypothetical protein E5X79_16880 [Mesorhizobium sp.]TJV63882.1 MAG: hypothetical protein E5X80_14755 [Mesorhizobium sp.]
MRRSASCRTLENDFLEGALNKAGLLSAMKEMIDRNHALLLTRQARELGISRGSFYYLPRLPSATDLALTHRIDRLHLDYPLREAGYCNGF